MFWQRFTKTWMGVVRVSLLLSCFAGGMTSHFARAQTVPELSGQQGVRATHAAPSGDFVDPLDAPAVKQRSVAGQPFMSVVRAGQRLVAVGMRGLIAVSDDQGKTWAQVPSPVRSDLLALSFPTATDGWIVGHDGVVLHTDDGARTWSKQFDGRMAAASLVKTYKARQAAGESDLQPYVDELGLNYKLGPSLPLLSVWFKNKLNGIAVGPFGNAISTDDGGKSWVPILEHTANPQFLNLNAIRVIGEEVYVVGEKGRIFRVTADTGKFEAIDTGYAGSFFGLVGNTDVVVAYGLNGTLYRSLDRGAHWEKVNSPLRGSLTSAVYIPQRREFAFVSAAGEIALSDGKAQSLRIVKNSRPTVLTGVVALSDGGLLLAGLDGLRVAAIR
jgi:photosystem II stability/assembly factor-like uncharacterized protein